MSRPILPSVLLAATLLAGCASDRPPDFAYDDAVPPLPSPPVTAPEDRPRPLHVPPAWTPSRGGEAAATPVAQVGNANAAARVEPRQAGYFNAIQIYPWSEGALYQVYAAPGQITTIALEPGERLAGTGPIAAGDTVVVKCAPDRTQRERRDLDACHFLGLSACARDTPRRVEHAAHPARACAQPPLRVARRQPALAAGLGLR